MPKAEVLNDVAIGSSLISAAAMLAGPGVFDFPIGLGGWLNAGSILENSPAYIRGQGLNTLNPLGGYHTYTPELLHMQPNGVPDVMWHTTYHAYNFAQGFDVVAGEAALFFLATAGVAKLASVVGRRFSRGSVKK